MATKRTNTTGKTTKTSVATKKTTKPTTNATETNKVKTAWVEQSKINAEVLALFATDFRVFCDVMRFLEGTSNAVDGFIDLKDFLDENDGQIILSDNIFITIIDILSGNGVDKNIYTVPLVDKTIDNTYAANKLIRSMYFTEGNPKYEYVDSNNINCLDLRPICITGDNFKSVFTETLKLIQTDPNVYRLVENLFDIVCQRALIFSGSGNFSLADSFNSLMITLAALIDMSYKKDNKVLNIPDIFNYLFITKPDEKLDNYLKLTGKPCLYPKSIGVLSRMILTNFGPNKTYYFNNSINYFLDNIIKIYTNGIFVKYLGPYNNSFEGKDDKDYLNKPYHDCIYDFVRELPNLHLEISEAFKSILDVSGIGNFILSYFAIHKKTYDSEMIDDYRNSVAQKISEYLTDCGISNITIGSLVYPACVPMSMLRNIGMKYGIMTCSPSCSQSLNHANFLRIMHFVEDLPNLSIFIKGMLQIIEIYADKIAKKVEMLDCYSTRWVYGSACLNILASALEYINTNQCSITIFKDVFHNLVSKFDKLYYIMTSTLKIVSDARFSTIIYFDDLFERLILLTPEVYNNPMTYLDCIDEIIHSRPIRNNFDGKLLSTNDVHISAKYPRKVCRIMNELQNMMSGMFDMKFPSPDFSRIKLPNERRIR